MAAESSTVTPEIRVYAMFPRKVILDADLDLDPSNWRWIHCLTLPVQKLNALQFSQRPYKWIRYATGVVVGAEGDLSSSPHFLNVVDYNANLPAESAILYYQTSDEEKRRMFPADPNMGREQVTSSVSSTRRAQFAGEVASRDGNVCVLTGAFHPVCDAAHLVAHSKGDTYISTYTRRRSRDSDGADIVEDIDSIRNGLFLNKFTHVALGQGVAFLRTPNFAMDTSDVDFTLPPTEERCTTHLFEPDVRYYLGDTTLPLGSPLHMSNTPDWPPAILFDAIYASSVFHCFGAQALKDEGAAPWKEAFYGVMSAGQADYKALLDKRAADADKSSKHNQERDARFERHRCPDTFDMLLNLPYILVPPDELHAMRKKAHEIAEAKEQGRVQEMVSTWARQVASQ